MIMKQDDFLIFAELNRERFEDILDRLMQRFPNVQFGRQGDDWIWVHLDDGKVEIDSFYSSHLELKGARKHANEIKRMLGMIEKDWILKRFDPPKEDLTR
jgi:hypothetical protein